MFSPTRRVASKLALKIAAKIIDFPRDGSFAGWLFKFIIVSGFLYHKIFGSSIHFDKLKTQLPSKGVYMSSGAVGPSSASDLGDSIIAVSTKSNLAEQIVAARKELSQSSDSHSFLPTYIKIVGNWYLISTKENLVGYSFEYVPDKVFDERGYSEEKKEANQQKKVIYAIGALGLWGVVQVTGRYLNSL